ncbi:MAG: DUF21 domain-containing protein [Desulfobacteraceae bacterium]|nr:DUF21 domain-containing protein [Desulfobacteraceae bacterium]
MTAITWIGIIICLSQSAVFSGVNIAVFSISRLRLEALRATGHPEAIRLLNIRQNSNFLLTTILWGNVGINVLLTLLSGSVMAGVYAFLFSTILITFAGEIIPQAYFSRYALRMASLLMPLLRFYQIVLYPVAKPSAILLDLWLGKEGIHYFRERDLREVIKMHMVSDETELDHVESAGALNFLDFDDLPVVEEGESIHPESILAIQFTPDGSPIFPDFNESADDPFLEAVERSGKKWIILTDMDGIPQLVMDADGFLRNALFESRSKHHHVWCHRPVMVTDRDTRLGDIIQKLKVYRNLPEDDVIDHDIILVWTDDKKIITGADILGRLLRGITSAKPTTALKRK